MLAKLKGIVIWLAILFILGWLTEDAYDHVRAQPVLRQNGVEVIGKLKEAEVTKYLFFTIRRNLTVQYLDTYSSDFAVSKEVFQRYVKDDKFMENTPVPVLYLSENPRTSELSEMLGKIFYWGGPGIDLIMMGSILFVFVLITLMGLIEEFRNYRRNKEQIL